MPSVTSYTKAQIDTLLAGAKGIPGRTTIATPSPALLPIETTSTPSGSARYRI